MTLLTRYLLKFLRERTHKSLYCRLNFVKQPWPIHLIFW